MGAKICTPSPQKLQNEIHLNNEDFYPNESISIPQNIPNPDDISDDYYQQDHMNFQDIQLNLPDYDHELIFSRLPLFPSTDHHNYKDILQKHLVRMQTWNTQQKGLVIDTKRVLAEIKILGKTLPVQLSNSIFVVVNQNNMGQMQSIIFGSQGTPYENGAFLYTINLLQTYPNQPPKVNLQTTGNQKIRFNPNLYQTGYVCLSLLGTWTGESKQNWQPAVSNISQVLLSIQTIVMNEDVYYNEPSYQDADKNQCQYYNTAYQNIVKFGNIAYAMNDMIQNPPALFSKIIKTHFYIKRNKILETVYKWIQDNTQALYMDLTQEHNYHFCARYASKWVYKNDLIRQLHRLYTNLGNIKIQDTLIEEQKIQKQIIQQKQVIESSETTQLKEEQKNQLKQEQIYDQ